jgi:hypothetical protein
LSGRLKNMDIPEEERFFDQWETEYYTKGSTTKGKLVITNKAVYFNNIRLEKVNILESSSYRKFFLKSHVVIKMKDGLEYEFQFGLGSVAQILSAIDS